MQEGERNFDRARNDRDLGVLGDPERWGSTEPITIEVIGNDTYEVTTNQMIRVQCQDLIARSWDLIVQWHLDGFEGGDDILRCVFELTIGVGQASRKLVLDLTAALSGYPAAIGPIGGNAQMPPVAWEVIPWASGYADGTVTLSWPIPAVTLAGRFILRVEHQGGVPVHQHVIRGSAFAAVSPRALV